MGFHWSLSNSKSHQFSRTLLSLLSNTVVWMVLILPLISNYSSFFFINLLRTIPSIPTSINITVTLIFHSLLVFSLARAKYLSVFSLSFIFTSGSPEQQYPLDSKFSLINTQSGLLVRYSDYLYQSVQFLLIFVILLLSKFIIIIFIIIRIKNRLKRFNIKNISCYFNIHANIVTIIWQINLVFSVIKFLLVGLSANQHLLPTKSLLF